MAAKKLSRRHPLFALELYLFQRNPSVLCTSSKEPSLLDVHCARFCACRHMHRKHPRCKQFLTVERSPRSRPGLKAPPAVVDFLRGKRKIDRAIVTSQDRRESCEG